MNRRQVLTVFAGAAVLGPRIASAQRKPRRIGWLGPVAGGSAAARMDAFRAGMSEHGYVEGRHYAIVLPKHESGDLETLGKRAEELIAQQVDAIVATNTPAALAVVALSHDIPVFIASVADPVGFGLAATLSRPGGTVTGLTGLGRELVGKRLELLRELLPTARAVAFAYDVNSTEERLQLKDFDAMALKHRLRRVALTIASKDDIARVGALLQRTRGSVDALILPYNSTRDAWIVTVLVQQRLPAIHANSEAVRAGGLLSYAPDFNDQFRRVAGYVDKVFKGAKPGDLPIEQPTKFELAVNLRTAKVLGITVPQSILLRSTRVIE